MASGAVAQVRCLGLLALAAVLSCLLQVAASQPRPLIQATAWDQTPLAVEAAGGQPATGAGGDAALRRGCTYTVKVKTRRRGCTYTVKVKTSCSSPAWSSDAVSLAFGDAYRNEVYVAQLAPRAGFEACATDTFRVFGPCGYGVCYLYLYRSGGGRYGWAPEWVRVYEPSSPTPSTFYYGGDAIPAGVWYGFNRCPRRGAGGDAGGGASVAAAQSM